MATIKQEVQFYNDEVGRVLPNAKIYTYEAGDINTPKQTYTDKSLQFANEWPVQADARGIFPVMWAEAGDYLLVYTDEDDNEFARRDNIGASDSISISAPMFATLSDLISGTTYDGTIISLIEGTICQTAGEITVRDSRSSDWLIVASSTPVDNVTTFALDNGLVAERLSNKVSNIYGFIDGVGTLVTESANNTDVTILSVTNPGTGVYAITLSQDVAVQSVTVSAAQNTTPRFIEASYTTGGLSNLVTIYGQDISGTSVSTLFSFNIAFKYEV